MPDPETVLDLGANIGLVAAHYRELWPKARIVSVEMDLGNASQAIRNGAEVQMVAVAACSGTRAYTKMGEQAYAYKLTDTGDIPVRAEALESLIHRLFNGHVDFIKMDIEGTEWELFLTLDKWAHLTDYLLVELHGPDPLERAEEMLNEFFRTSRHTRHPQALYCEALARRQPAAT